KIWKYDAGSWVETVDTTMNGRYCVGGTQDGLIFAFDNYTFFEGSVNDLKRKIDYFKSTGKNVDESENLLNLSLNAAKNMRYTNAMNYLVGCKNLIEGLGAVPIEKCQSCLKKIEQEWIICPYCGKRLK
ncbi:MAG: hypothetical protein KKE04_02615, partial [Candidatus Thermoplasmatota archaeon]|nr:hypothetical protein [Candidatus Thermoplasmatota archaeon]